ncbi:MAG TPA: hypothetical protein PKY77_19985 [Phycisphaerae bacterium]|nr:hypothetical protein [Phycisphaerae bacterium]HRY70642.1 hypothetical protein [Phycisphaerae bacterium]HSA28957.1 hypothetical protein [Phycisphaerae bacterium]
MTTMIRWSDRPRMVTHFGALLAAVCLLSWTAWAEAAVSKRARGVALGTAAADSALSFDPFAPAGTYTSGASLNTAAGIQPSLAGLSSDQPVADTGAAGAKAGRDMLAAGPGARYRPPIRVPYRPPLRSPWRPPLV